MVPGNSVAAAVEFSLPYSGSVAAGGTSAFQVTNTGIGAATAISATLENASSGDACAGEFRADGCSGNAIYASSDSTTIKARQSGRRRQRVLWNVGWATAAASSGVLRSNGYGVKAEAHCDQWVRHDWRLVRFAQQPTAKACTRKPAGDYGTALFAEATGGEGYAIKAESSWVGIQAEGSLAAAQVLWSCRYLRIRHLHQGARTRQRA